MKHALVLTNNTGLTKMKLVNGIEPTNNDKKINKTPSLRTWPRNNGYEATPMGVCQIKMWIQNQFPTHWPSVGPSRHLGVSEKCVGTGNFQSLSRWALPRKVMKSVFNWHQKMVPGTWTNHGGPLMFVPPGFDGLDFWGCLCKRRATVSHEIWRWRRVWQPAVTCGPEQRRRRRKV